MWTHRWGPRSSCILNYQQDCIPVGCVPPACCPYLPACTALGGGVWSQRVCLLLVRGGVPASGPGGGCLPLVLGVYPSMQWGNPPCGQNSWHTLLKILPCPNYVAGGNMKAFQLSANRQAGRQYGLHSEQSWICPGRGVGAVRSKFETVLVRWSQGHVQGK